MYCLNFGWTVLLKPTRVTCHAPIWLFKSPVPWSILLLISPFNYIPFCSQILSVPCKWSPCYSPDNIVGWCYFPQFFSSNHNSQLDTNQSSVLWMVSLYFDHTSTAGASLTWYWQLLQEPPFAWDTSGTSSQLHLCSTKTKQKHNFFLWSSALHIDTRSALSRRSECAHYGLEEIKTWQRQMSKLHHCSTPIATEGMSSGNTMPFLSVI